jgi:serine/threonine protein phosphatase PrpC
MKHKLHYHQGKRENQEDSFGFVENILYVVCDGVGGHAKGEVASKFIVDFITQNLDVLEKELSKNTIEQYVVQSQHLLNRTIEQDPSAEGMGTTLAAVLRGPQGMFVMHIGDSRVYLVRPSTQQIWHTWDHSLVGNLMQMGEITREHGRFHPQGNRISRAILANSKDKTATPEITKVTHVEPGDIFLICSDGVTEAWSEFELMKLLCNTQLSLDEKRNSIAEVCSANSRDNNTAILLEIDQNSAFFLGENEELQWLSLADFKADFEEYQEKIAEQQLIDEEKAKSAAQIQAQEDQKTPQDADNQNDADTPEILATCESDLVVELITPKQKPRRKLPLMLMLLSILLIGAAYVAFSFWKEGKEEREMVAEPNLTLSLFKENKLYGYKLGDSIVIPPQFNSAEDFINGLAKVSRNDSVFFIDKKGDFQKLLSGQKINTNIEFPQVETTHNQPEEQYRIISSDVQKWDSAKAALEFKKLTSDKTKIFKSSEENSFLDKINSELKDSYQNAFAIHNKRAASLSGKTDINTPKSNTP